MIKIKLAVLLAERGMNQADLATVTDLSPAIIGRIVKGENVRINFKHISKICTALDCEISDIYEYVRVPDPETHSEAKTLNDEVSRTLEALESIVDRHVKWRTSGMRAYRDDDL